MSNPTYNYKKFVWRELQTHNPAKAIAFYSEVIGWKISEVPWMEGVYRLIFVGEKMIGGIFELPKHVQAPAHWSSFVSVPDVEAAANKAVALGGRILAGPIVDNDTGTWTVVQDPTGAVFTLYKAIHGDKPLSMPQAGEFCWEDLQTTNIEQSTAFYKEVIGWETVPFAPNSSVQVFTSGPEMSQMAASLGTAQPGHPSAWLTHITVDNLSEARARVLRHGGKVLEEAIPVPGIGVFAVVTDLEGAVFCIFEDEKKA